MHLPKVVLGWIEATVQVLGAIRLMLGYRMTEGFPRSVAGWGTGDISFRFGLRNRLLSIGEKTASDQRRIGVTLPGTPVGSPRTSWLRQSLRR
jgi:hypothetical protein